MDPNANLEEIRETIKSLRGHENDSDAKIATDGERLADLVEALDEWISKGGFVPTEWQNGTRKEALEFFLGASVTAIDGKKV